MGVLIFAHRQKMGLRGKMSGTEAEREQLDGRCTGDEPMHGKKERKD